jgi:hypothetical protein
MDTNTIVEAAMMSATVGRVRNEEKTKKKKKDGPDVEIPEKGYPVIPIPETPTVPGDVDLPYDNEHPD